MTDWNSAGDQRGDLRASQVESSPFNHKVFDEFRFSSNESANTPWRAHYGSVAPSAQILQPGGSEASCSTDQPAPWRRSYNSVAPSATDSSISPSNERLAGEAQEPTQSWLEYIKHQPKPNNGANTGTIPTPETGCENKPVPQCHTGNGPCPWKSGSTGAEGAANTSLSENHESWMYYIKHQPQGSLQLRNADEHSVKPEIAKPELSAPMPYSVPTSVETSTPGTSHGGSDLQSDRSTRSIVSDSLITRTSVKGFLYTGGLAGSACNAAVHVLDTLILRFPESSKLKFWEPYSASKKYLEECTAVLESKKNAFTASDEKFRVAQSEHSAVKHIPENMLKLAEERAATISPPKEKSIEIARLRSGFLNQLPTLSSPQEVRKAVGAKVTDGHNGVLFARSSALGQRLISHASKMAEGDLSSLHSFQSDALAWTKRLEDLQLKVNAYTVAHKRVEFFKNLRADHISEVAANTGTMHEVNAATKLFTSGTAESVALFDYARKCEAMAACRQQLQVVQNSLQQAEKIVGIAKVSGADIVHGTLPCTSTRGLFRGIGISAVSLAAGFAVDSVCGKVLNYTPGQDGAFRYLLDGVVLPSIALSSLPARYKISASLLTFGVARATDMCLGKESSLQMSHFWRLNGLDAMAVTAATMLPVSLRAKAWGLAGGLGMSRVYNELFHLSGNDGEAGSILNRETQSSTSSDAATSTTESFEHAVQKAKELGLANPAALELQAVDQINRTDQGLLESARRNAILSYGLGLARLQLGSRFDVTDHDPLAYFLKDEKYDFACTAAEQLHSALKSLDDAANYVWQHKGEKDSHNHLLDEAYLAQLQKLRSKVINDLDGIYGVHDIEAVYRVIRDKCRSEEDKVLKFTADGASRLGELGPTLNSLDRRYAAKMCRDLCIANLAYAETKYNGNNPADAREFFAVAQNHLHCAETFEDSPNNEKLSQMLSSVASRLQSGE